jgi:hypothetical protein
VDVADDGGAHADLRRREADDPAVPRRDPARNPGCYGQARGSVNE